MVKKKKGPLAVIVVVIVVVAVALYSGVVSPERIFEVVLLSVLTSAITWLIFAHALNTR